MMDNADREEEHMSQDEARGHSSPWLGLIAFGLFAFSGYAVWSSYTETYHGKSIGHFASASLFPGVQPKHYIDGDRQYLWASGPMDPGAEDAEWFDLTGSPFPVTDFEFGIGKDRIPAIDHPVFVKPDDPRLSALRKITRSDQIDKIQILGYANNREARAYPVDTMNLHELVNDRVGGKPVTVGW